MRSIRGRRWIPLALIGAGLSGAACGADDSALDLKPAAEPAPASAAAKSMRLFGELAVGRLGQRYDLGTQSTRRPSIDFTWDGRPAPQWRAVLSDRLDNFHPASSGERSTLNSLREAYVGWQDEEARNAVDVGRVNARYGPAYGFNPTDFLRDGSVRSVSSADPLAQRENRLGTAMVRLQRLWGGGSMSLAVAPKLSDAPSRESFSADWGATNHADRVLAAWSLQPSDRVDIWSSPSVTTPRWTLVKTVKPSVLNAASQVSATFTLPTGATQAVRVTLRRSASAVACPTGGYDDKDDLVFVTR